jgi:hypothetical protein
LAKAPAPSREQAVLAFVAQELGPSCRIRSHGPKARQIQTVTAEGYPEARLVTFVTVGLSRAAFSLYRGCECGFEVTLTTEADKGELFDTLVTAVLEHLRLKSQRTPERRPFIEHNGVYAPGYPPHLLFTTRLSCTPKLAIERKKLGDAYVTFLAAIPLSEAELRRYDRSLPGLIDELSASGKLARYPRD